MKSLTLTIFAVLASFLLITHSAAEEEDNEFYNKVYDNLQQIAQKRARACMDNFLDPIGLYCNYKRGLPRNRRSIRDSRFDME